MTDKPIDNYDPRFPPRPLPTNNAGNLMDDIFDEPIEDEDGNVYDTVHLSGDEEGNSSKSGVEDTQGGTTTNSNFASDEQRNAFWGHFKEAEGAPDGGKSKGEAASRAKNDEYARVNELSAEDRAMSRYHTSDLSSMSPLQRAEHYQKLLDEEYERQQPRPSEVKEVSDEEHRAASSQLTEGDRISISRAHGWEETRPWNMTMDQLKEGKVPGFVLTKRRGTEVAEYLGDGKIGVSPGFFEDTYQKHEEARRHILYHELGHLLADTMSKDGTDFKLLDNGVIPKKHDLGSGTAQGHGMEEALADSYALLHSDPKWLKNRYPEMANHVVKRARALGMPLPKEQT